MAKFSKGSTISQILTLVNFLPEPFQTKFSIINDPIKGRCLKSNCELRVGQVLYEESALVYAKYAEHPNDYDEERLTDCMNSFYSSYLVNNIDSVEEDLSDLATIQSLDTARCLLQLVALIYNKKQPLPAKLLELLNSLTFTNVEECQKDIKSFRKLHPKVFPKDLKDVDIARLLGKLNSNQLELEDYGGSGLFLGTAIIEHSCQPNCSFTTNDTKLYMTAILPIAPGDFISIDYGNFYYDPYEIRREELWKTYHFPCTCKLCSEDSIDSKRSFHCEFCYSNVKRSSGSNGKQGVIFPYALKLYQMADPSIAWTRCNVCQLLPSLSHINKCLEEEMNYKQNDPTSYEDIIAFMGRGYLFETHYLIFHSLNELVLRLADEEKHDHKSFSSIGIPSKVSALMVMNHLMTIVDCPHPDIRVIPSVHHERLILYDKWAQLSIAATHRNTISVQSHEDPVQQAKKYFKMAYEMSCLACGSSVPITLKLKELVTNTPKTLAELLTHYSK